MRANESSKKNQGATRTGNLRNAYKAKGRGGSGGSGSSESSADSANEKLEPIRVEDKVGRNDPCPCGSEKKYKKCCLNKEEAKDAEK